MTLRPLFLLGLFGLLAACSSNDAPEPVPAKPVAPAIKLPTGPGPLQPYQRELSGQLLGVQLGPKSSWRCWWSMNAIVRRNC